MSIFVAHWLTGREISPINRKTGDRLPDRAGQRLESEIAIPAIFFRQSVEHTAEHFDFVRERDPRHQSLLRVNKMSEVHRVTDEAVKRLRDCRFGRAVHQHVRDLICEIVAGCSMHRPIRAQFLRAG